MGLTVTRIRYEGFFHEMTVVSDAPVGVEDDRLAYRRYIDPLLSILVDPEQETPFTIGVFGPWGSGKSSVLRMLDERLERDYPDQFVRVPFNPWVHRGEPNLLIPLLHALRDTLEADQAKRFLASVEKIGEIMLRLAADVLLKKLTGDAVSLEKLEKLEASYLKARTRIDDGMRNLRKTLQAQFDAIKKAGANVVLLIDDLDRCQPDEIISLLEAIKLFLDLHHVFIVLAVDREVVNRGIQVRYGKFKFAEDRTEVIGGEYLEKIVQLPMELFPLDRSQVGQLLEKLCAGAGLKDMRQLLEQVAIPNPRKIKRLLNIFAVTRALVLADEELKKLDQSTILRLVAIQVQYPEIYLEVTRNPLVVVALERTFRGEHRPTEEQDYQIYGPLRKSVYEVCKKYYRPGGVLAAIFSDSLFVAKKDDLPRYLSVLGGLGG